MLLIKHCALLCVVNYLLLTYIHSVKCEDNSVIRTLLKNFLGRFVCSLEENEPEERIVYGTYKMENANKSYLQTPKKAIDRQGIEISVNRLKQAGRDIGINSCYGCSSLKKNKKSLITYSGNKGFIGDPCGFIYLNGKYHIFYQHSSRSHTHEFIGWGHAVSKDLITWKEKNDALHYNTKTGEQRFSGCVVLDKNNCSGLGKVSGKAVLVAFYTSRYSSKTQSVDGRILNGGWDYVSIAYSLDLGIHWNIYTKNPLVLPKRKNIRNFRDPKVFWHENKWVMLVTLYQRQEIYFYSSNDLIQWTYMSSYKSLFTPFLSKWECPNLFEINVENSKKTKWVLILSLQWRGLPTIPRDAVYYVTGNFDGTSFTEDGELNNETFKQLDYGRDFYCAMIGTRANNFNEKLIIGWVNNWDYALKNIKIYRGGLSLRELKLINKNGIFRLIQKPVTELAKYINTNDNYYYNEKSVANGIRIATNQVYNIKVTPTNENEFIHSFSLSIEDIEGNEIVILYYKPHQENITISIKRPRIRHRYENENKVIVDDKLKNVNIFIDFTSLILFCNDGQVVFTELLNSELKMRIFKLHI